MEEWVWNHEKEDTSTCNKERTCVPRTKLGVLLKDTTRWNVNLVINNPLHVYWNILVDKC